MKLQMKMRSDTITIFTLLANIFNQGWTWRGLWEDRIGSTRKSTSPSEQLHWHNLPNETNLELWSLLKVCNFQEEDSESKLSLIDQFQLLAQ